MLTINGLSNLATLLAAKQAGLSQGELNATIRQEKAAKAYDAKPAPKHGQRAMHWAKSKAELFRKVNVKPATIQGPTVVVLPVPAPVKGWTTASYAAAHGVTTGTAGRKLRALIKAGKATRVRQGRVGYLYTVAG